MDNGWAAHSALSPRLRRIRTNDATHTHTHERLRRPSARQHINEHCQKHTHTHACTNARARCPPIYLSTVLKYLCEQYVGHHRVALHGSRNSIIFINICTRRAAAVASRARLSMYTCLESVHSARHINRNAPHTHTTRRDATRAYTINYILRDVVCVCVCWCTRADVVRLCMDGWRRRRRRRAIILAGDWRPAKMRSLGRVTSTRGLFSDAAPLSKIPAIIYQVGRKNRPQAIFKNCY